MSAEREISRKIKELMVAQGLTRAELAKKLGRTEDSVKKILSGVGLVQFIKLGELARILGTTPNDLLGISASPDNQALLSAMAVSYETLGLEADEGQELAQIVLQASREAQVFAGDVSLPSTARILASAAVARFRPK